jgi:putative aminopeptidase FrvX
VAAGLIGIPNRYMHGPVEVVSLDDLEKAAHLLAEKHPTASFALAHARAFGLE